MLHRNAALTSRARLRLARLVVDEGWSVAQAARRYDVSWRTAKRWTDRYREEGADGMQDRSSRLLHSPTRTPQHVVCKVVHLRFKQRLGPVQIGGRLNMPALTVHGRPVSRLQTRSDRRAVRGDAGSMGALRRHRSCPLRTEVARGQDRGAVQHRARHSSTPRSSALIGGVVLSFEVGLVRLDPAIYACALELLDVPGSHALMVGDGPRDDVGGVPLRIRTLILPPHGTARCTGWARFCRWPGMAESIRHSHDGHGLRLYLTGPVDSAAVGAQRLGTAAPAVRLPDGACRVGQSFSLSRTCSSSP